MNLSDIATALGRRGGRIRAQRLSAERKAQIASLGGTARSKSLQAARRIDDNFRYLSAVRSLRGRSRTVLRQQRFNGRLPGIYPTKP